jgi:DDE_Tnp_1-associated
MIFIALCAAIGDATTWVDVERFAKAKEPWLRRYLKLPNVVPSHNTFSRVFARLDTEEFYRCLRGKSVAINCKTFLGSFDTAADQSTLHSVSAWACGPLYPKHLF